MFLIVIVICENRTILIGRRTFYVQPYLLRRDSAEAAMSDRGSVGTTAHGSSGATNRISTSLDWHDAPSWQIVGHSK
jgi:hypothetical protein